VNMFRFQVFTDSAPRTRNGQPHQRTTGVASANSIHCTYSIDRPAGSRPGARSAAIASRNSGVASSRLSWKRRVMSISSSFFSSMVTVFASSAIPHFGHAPGCSCTTSGCIGQVYCVFVASRGVTLGSSAMPQLGQAPG